MMNKLLRIPLFLYLFGCCSAAGNDDKSAKVLILGAGMSGISAAQRLEEQGVKDFLILEGTDRVGGRVREARLGDYNVEMGALWIHGGTTNPIYKLSQKYNVSSVESDYEDYIVRNMNGTDSTDILDEAYETLELAMQFMENKTEELLSDDKPDVSLRGVLMQGGWNPKTPEEDMAEIFEFDYEFAVTPSLISTKYPGTATFEIFGDTDYVTINPNGGYGQIIRGMADELFSDNDSTQRLYFDTIVTEIHQNDSHVTVMTKDGQTFVAESVIVTFSLGVLQNRLVKFEPDLPAWKWDTIFAYQFNIYLHFYLQFPSAFWDVNEYIMFASEQRGRYPIWQNMNKFWPGSNILQCAVVHVEAERLLAMSDDEIKADVMEVLRNMYGNAIPNATSMVVPRYSTDPMFMGVFSNWPPGFSADSHKALQVATGLVHFAGEHLSFEYSGYLHGAHISGIEAADEVIKCMENQCEEYVPPYDARGCTYKEATNYKKMYQDDDGSCKFPKNSKDNSAGNTVDPPKCMLALLLITLFAL